MASRKDSLKLPHIMCKYWKESQKKKGDRKSPQEPYDWGLQTLRICSGVNRNQQDPLIRTGHLLFAYEYCIAMSLQGHISACAVPATTTVCIFSLPFGLVLPSCSQHSRNMWCTHDPPCVRNAPGGDGSLSVGGVGTSFLGWPSASENRGRIVS